MGIDLFNHQVLSNAFIYILHGLARTPFSLLMEILVSASVIGDFFYNYIKWVISMRTRNNLIGPPAPIKPHSWFWIIKQTLRIGYWILVVGFFIGYCGFQWGYSYSNYKNPSDKTTAEKKAYELKDEFYRDFLNAILVPPTDTEEQKRIAFQPYVNKRFYERRENFRYDEKTDSLIFNKFKTPRELYDIWKSELSKITCNCKDGVIVEDSEKLREWSESIFQSIQPSYAGIFETGDSLKSYYDENIKSKQGDICDRNALCANGYNYCDYCYQVKVLEYLSKNKQAKSK